MPDLRMPEINRVYLAGRLTRDPELRYTPQGSAVCRMSLAVSRYFKGRDGERKEDTLFIDVTVWEKTAEYCGQRLRQGNPILVEGRLKSDSWEDKSTGQKRTKIEVQALRVQELAWSTERPAQGAAAAEARAAQPAGQPPVEEEPVASEDDIPF